VDHYKPQIVALGGGGFSMEPENPSLDLYVLDLAQNSNPAVSFLGTASGDADSYLVKFYSAFTKHDCRPSHLPLFTRTPVLRDHVFRQDIIYVGGGNTKSMLAVWRDWDLHTILREAWEEGIILAGISAGAICWFAQGVTDAYEGKLTVLDCLGFLEGSCCPHYDADPDRRRAYHDLLLNGQISSGYGVDDGAALHFVGSELHEVVSSRSGAHAYKVQVDQDGVNEEELVVELLPSVDTG